MFSYNNKINSIVLWTLCTLIFLSCEPNHVNGIEVVTRKFDYHHQILNVAYSVINDGYRMNTAEHFVSACDYGFNSLKADMRLTKDNQIVLCHDIGFTFDANHRITEFDPSNCTKIHEISALDIMQLEYDSLIPGTNRYARPMFLDSFLVLCRRKKVIPYLTLRTEYIDETLKVLVQALDKYKMQDDTIINLYPSDLEIAKVIINQFDIAVCLTLRPSESLDCDKKIWCDTVNKAVVCVNFNKYLEATDSLINTLNKDNNGYLVWYPPTQKAYKVAQSKGCIGAQIMNKDVIH